MTTQRDNMLSTALSYGIAVLALVFVVEVLFFMLKFGEWNAAEGQTFALEGSFATEIRELGDPEDFETVVSRPLFVWNRRPIPERDEPGVSQPDAGSIDSRWELNAVIASGDQTYAYFSEMHGDLRVRLEEGMFLEEWRVAAIQGDSVTLVGSEVDSPEEDLETKVFRLKELADTPARNKASRISRANSRKSPSRRSGRQEVKTAAEVGSKVATTPDSEAKR